jgi:hypothetical protein
MSPKHMDYEAIESPFIRERIRQTSWRKRGTIDELITLRRLMLLPGQSLRYAGAMYLHRLKQKYPVEYLELLAEIDPERARKVREDQRRQVEIAAFEAEVQEAKWKARVAAERESWLRAGGRE